jgi:bacterioferritin
MPKLNTKKVAAVLNKILEAELAGVVRYTHHSLMVVGYGRIPIISWLREQATESLLHSQQAGEWIVNLGEHPGLSIGPLLDKHSDDIGAILSESLKAEETALNLYKELLQLVENRSIALEEYARSMVYVEEMHANEVAKMLRKPGEFGV